VQGGVGQARQFRLLQGPLLQQAVHRAQVPDHFSFCHQDQPACSPRAGRAHAGAGGAAAGDDPPDRAAGGHAGEVQVRGPTPGCPTLRCSAPSPLFTQRPKMLKRTENAEPAVATLQSNPEAPLNSPSCNLIREHTEITQAELLSLLPSINRQGCVNVLKILSPLWRHFNQTLRLHPTPVTAPSA